MSEMEDRLKTLVKLVPKGENIEKTKKHLKRIHKMLKEQGFELQLSSVHNAFAISRGYQSFSLYAKHNK